MDEELVTVASFAKPLMAHLVQGRLEAEGIECYLADENMVSLTCLIGDVFGGVKVQVRRSDVERALGILRELSLDGDLVEEGAAGGEGSDSVPEERYLAAGAVVADGDRVLVLRRPRRGEIRLPKGHVQPGETARDAALREVAEESGWCSLEVRADLGTQRVEFDRGGVRVVRDEHYFLMSPTGSTSGRGGEHEAQFRPEWVTWDEAERLLTYEAEREWVRRARQAAGELDS